jgi:hypothetical protein
MAAQSVWEQFLAGLARWSNVRNVGDGRIELEIPHGATGRVIEIVMKPEDLQMMASITASDGDDTALYLKTLAAEMTAEQRFLVYHNYDLMPSETAVIPRWPGWERLRRLVEEHPGATYGWYAHPPPHHAPEHDETL